MRCCGAVDTGPEAAGVEFSSYWKIKSTPNLFFQGNLDTGHQLMTAVVVGIQVRFVSIVAVVAEHAPRNGQSTICAQGEPVTPLLARDLETASVDNIGIVVPPAALIAA